jgi:two-component system OmpR family response regulator
MAAPTRVLIVDDNKDFTAVIVTAIERAGLAVRAAGSGLEAIELCREFAPDTIILDIIMPDMDGVEFIGWLAATGYQARVIIVSAHSRYIDLAEKMAGVKGLTIAAVLSKPVRLPILLAVINA